MSRRKMNDGDMTGLKQDRNYYPFENGKLHNWNHKTGWDRYFDASYDKEANRPHGGDLIGHDSGGHTGRGP